MDTTAKLESALSGNDRVVAVIDAGVIWFARRWTLALTLLTVPIALFPVLAPVLKDADHHRLSGVIYFGYGFVCHQLPERSFHLRGEPMACCERDLAIFGTLALTLLFATLIPRLRSSPAAALRVALAASLPIAVDGTSQLVGLRESTWELRVATGAVFALGWAWFALPRLDAGFRNVASVIELRRTGSPL